MHVRILFGLTLTAAAVAAATPDTPLLPSVPPEFSVQLYAREPLVRNPCAMAFDARGRLFVGQGPQYRNPKPDTPGDTIVLLIDTDGDGVADKAQTFARGLNCVQGLAWHGRDLWVANAPDLTIVRDLDGDDVADEYIRVYTDLGNIEHALHGLNWAPDGKLYMSKGTSKGLSLPGRMAPKPFRDLWGVTAPAGTPDLPEPPRSFRAADYRATYQDPRDDWGREGGILRCDDLGANLEIVARGTRNSWDVSYDHGFNWLMTDNDQYDGDRILMPFYGAHFGWSHPWSADWTGENHLPTVPVSGPVFPGSGTGTIYADVPGFPAAWRGVWFINDWLRKTIFVYRPIWDGALLQPQGGHWEEFATGGGALFQPVDIEIGPDGALYVTGWGSAYGAVFKDGQQVNEGRVFRIAPKAAARVAGPAAKRERPLVERTTEELLEDLAAFVPARRTDAQDELVRRGGAVAPALIAALERPAGAPGFETWALWTLGRMSSRETAVEQWLTRKASTLSLNARLQALRIAAFRVRRSGEATPLPDFVAAALGDPEPRVRFEAVQAIWQARQKGLAEKLWDCASRETDRLTFYACWRALGELSSVAELKRRLADAQGGVRRAALLALLESDSLAPEEVAPRLADPDAQTAGVAALWQAKRNGNPLIVVDPAPRSFAGELRLRLLAGIKPAALRVTTDGSEPTAPSAGDGAREGQTLTLKQTTQVKAALFVPEKTDGGRKYYRKVGATFIGTWTGGGEAESSPPIVLEPPTKPLVVTDVLPLVRNLVAAEEGAAMIRGRQLFRAAGCMGCHRLGDDGQTFGPELTAIGDRGNARHIVESLLEPNAIVAEGFALQIVATRDGKTVAGMLRDETNRVLTLITPDAQPVSMAKDTIVTRETRHESIMPSFASAMSSRQMADLASWLLAQRSHSSQASSLTAAATSAGAPETAAHSALAAVAQGDRVTITDAGREVGSYFLSDPEILRPGWKNVRAPGGVAITRPHPPVAPETDDHATMHPGIWFALGDVNGADFWRNKGRMHFERWSESPHVVGGIARFYSIHRLVAPSGETIGHLELAQAFARSADGYLITCQAKLSSAEHDLVLGDQEEMGLGVRVPAAFTEKAGGTIRTSEGITGAKAAWGKVADWCSYARTNGGRVQGAAIFASPGNAHRSWWHTRDYGLMVANAFGAKAQPAIPEGKLLVPRGTPLVLRYAVLIFDAPVDAAPDFSAIYRQLCAEPEFAR